jgi:hypothetical protein
VLTVIVFIFFSLILKRKLLKENGGKFAEEDYRLLAMFLAQRFVPDFGGQDLRKSNEMFGQEGPLNYKELYKRMTPAEKKAFLAKYERVRARVLNMLRSLPTQVFLICR